MIEIKISVSGFHPRPEITWSEDWPIPRVGDEISLPGQPTMYVRHVIWYPEGDGESDGVFPNTDPFVYVVVGPRRPDWDVSP